MTAFILALVPSVVSPISSRCSLTPVVLANKIAEHVQGGIVNHRSSQRPNLLHSKRCCFQRYSGPGYDAKLTEPPKNTMK